MTAFARFGRQLVNVAAICSVARVGAETLHVYLAGEPGRPRVLAGNDAIRFAADLANPRTFNPLLDLATTPDDAPADDAEARELAATYLRRAGLFNLAEHVQNGDAAEAEAPSLS